MVSIRFKYLLPVLLALFFFHLLHAGISGKIVGRVVDKETGEFLVGCNVVVVGTAMGAASNLNGDYLVLNVPPGTYSIRAMMIGYTTSMVTNVAVNIDLTTTVNFELITEVLGGEEVTVVAERPMITRDLTASTAIVDASTISALPVTEISEVLELQAGFVNGHLRGGRKGEVAYWIDGVPVTDAYDGGTVVDVNKDAVQEMQLVSGAFNAEYGQAMSGIVNIVTKEGSERFGGNITVYSGDFLSGHNNLFMNINNFNPFTTRNFEGNIFGPIIPGVLSIYANARYIYYQGVHEGVNRFKPNSVGIPIPIGKSGTDSLYILGSDSEIDSVINYFLATPKYQNKYSNPDSPSYISWPEFEDSLYQEFRAAHKNPLGDGTYVPMDWNRKLYGQIKLTWRISPTTKIKYGFINDDVIYQDYDDDDLDNDRMYRYNPEGNLKHYRTGSTHLVQATHSLGSQTYFTIGLTQFEKNYKHRTYLKEKDNLYVHNLLLLTEPYSFYIGGTNNNIFSRQTKTQTAKFDLTSQLNLRHQLKMGLEYRRHLLHYKNIDLQPPKEKLNIDPILDDPYLKNPQVPHDSTINSSSYGFKPREFSIYVQDKMEFDELIVNLGVRFDYFDPRGRILSDPSDPSVYSPIRPENRYIDLNESGVQDPYEPSLTVADREKYWYQSTTPKWKISPRFGASFPFTARGVIHFSYGHFFQIPRFELLYRNPDFDLDRGTGNVGVVGNADLRPEKTVSGELGLQQQLTRDITIDLTAYFRDIRDLTGTRAEDISMFGGASSYSRLVNSDFAFIRGVVLSVDHRMLRGFSGSFDYTFQIARGSASDPEQARNAVQGGALPEVHLIPLNWDQHHTVNAVISYTQSRWGISLLGQLGSGLPYTPQSTQDITSLVTNSSQKPTTWTTDVRAYWKIPTPFGEMTGFLRVFNLFDRLNHWDVYDDSGVADVTNRIELAKNQNTPENVNTIEEWYRNETFYSTPRRIEIGLTYGF